MGNPGKISSVIAVIVGGVIIAGATLGWDKLVGSITSLLPSVKIESSAVGRNSRGPFYAGEKIWLKLAGAEADRVYWAFDEGDQLISSGVQIQHAFPFKSKSDKGSEEYHRVDAFYRAGDRYKWVSTKVQTMNQKLAAVATEENSLNITAPEKIDSQWSLAAVSLTKFANGMFTKTADVPVAWESSGPEKHFAINYSDIATALGFKSAEDAKMYVSENPNLWISTSYRHPPGSAEEVAILQELPRGRDVTEKPKMIPEIYPKKF